MKLKYLIPSVMAALMMFVSCSDDFEPTYLDDVRLSTSYVSIPVDGGNSTITVTAQGDWALQSQKWIAGKDTTIAATPKWLTVSTVSGGAGETQLTFSADATLDGRTAELLLNCGGKTQRINVIQGLSAVSDASVKEVLEGIMGKTYRVKGTISAWYSNYEQYGNMYITDETGTLLIYGMADKNGTLKNYPVKSWGLEIGDEITVEGILGEYKGTPQLVDVILVKLNKSLIKVEEIDPEDAVMPVEGGEFTVTLSNKGQGVYVTVPEDAASWLSISSISGNVVKFRVAANDGGDRSTNIVFKTIEGKKEYTCEQALSQKGAIVAATVAEFLAAEVGTTQYRLNGIITRLYYYKENVAGFYIADYSGETLVYKASGFTGTEAKPGDVVTVVGQRGDYKGTAQLVSGMFEKVDYVVTEVSIADFLTKEDDKNVYYKVTGTLDEIANPTYGNVYLKDGDQRLYVYGCYPGWGASGDARKNCLADKNIEVGDKLTVIGVKATFNDAPQVSNGIYFSHVKANEE